MHKRVCVSAWSGVETFIFNTLHIRDRSLITARGGLQNGKIAGPNLFLSHPPQDRVKLFVSLLQ